MIVYMDVLIFLNTLVDYFLLLATAKITNEKTTTFRTVLAALLGGISSIYIYLPQQRIIVEFLYKSAVAFLLTLVCYKLSGVKRYLKNVAVFLVVSCAYGGIMFALWAVFKPFGMVINNSVVYLNISPLMLVIFSTVAYVGFTIGFKIFKKSSPLATRCDVLVAANGREITLSAIADTGNSLEDVFSDSEIIIADKSKVISLFGDTDCLENSKYAHLYRLLPCNTVSGYSSLEGFRCEKALVECGSKKITLKKPILAVSKVPLKEDYNAIINPKILR